MSAGAVTEIYLVRHGETDWNRARRLQGRIDTHLNRVGVAQARHIADRFRTLAERGCGRASGGACGGAYGRACGRATIFTSPLARARSTARAIALRNRSALEIDPRLMEIDHGAWAGLTISHIADTIPGAVMDGRLRAEALDLSGGETLAAAYSRASTALQRLVAISGAAPVVVVSHGVTNALLMCAAVGKAPVQMDEYMQPNGCTYRLCFRQRVLVAVECAPLAVRLSDDTTSACPMTQRRRSKDDHS